MLTEVILPIFFIVFLGAVLRRLGGVDEKVFSRTQLYILSPALIFAALTRNSTELSLLLEALLFIAILSVTLFSVAQGAGFLLREDRVTRNAVSLASMFSNSGFYGIPVCMLAFGDQGVVYAAIFVAGSSTMQSTLGIYTASAGRKTPGQAFRTILRVPMLYSIVLAKLLLYLNALPPESFMKMINLLGNSAIPLGLLLLGMQLEGIISQLLRRRNKFVPEREAKMDGRAAALGTAPAARVAPAAASSPGSAARSSAIDRCRSRSPRACSARRWLVAGAGRKCRRSTSSAAAARALPPSTSHGAPARSGAASARRASSAITVRAPPAPPSRHCNRCTRSRRAPTM